MSRNAGWRCALCGSFLKYPEESRVETEVRCKRCGTEWIVPPSDESVPRQADSDDQAASQRV